jgi:hypothetical protein
MIKVALKHLRGKKRPFFEVFYVLVLQNLEINSKSICGYKLED